MININKKIVYFLLLIILISSCGLSFRNDEPKEPYEPPYNLPLVWRSDTSTRWLFQGILEGRYLYIYENISTDPSSDYLRLSKIDLENNGQKEWTTETSISRVASCAPVIIDDVIYITTAKTYIYCFDKNNGKTLGIAKVNAHNEELKVRDNLVAHNNYIYFGLGEGSININDLVRIHTDDITYNPDDLTEQAIEPEVVWSSKYHTRIVAIPVIKDDVIFCVTSFSFFYGNNGKPTELTALDANTKEIVWEKEITDDDGEGHLLIVGDILYLLSQMGVSAYCVEDGERLFIRTDMPLPHFTTEGTAYYKGKLYYTNNSAASFSANPSIVCLDAIDGSTVWGALPYKSPSLGPKPLVYQDKLFFVYSRGVLVYDAETGEFLGIDKSYSGFGSYGIMFHYKDLMIFPEKNANDGKYYSYVAVDIGG